MVGSAYGESTSDPVTVKREHFRCVICGSKTDLPTEVPELYDLRGFAQWRCQKCFSEVNARHLHCPHCGDGKGNRYAAECQAAYRNNYISCQCEQVNGKLQTTDDGITELKHVMACYFVCLVPIILLMGFSYHSESEMSLEAEFIFGAIFYVLILIFAVINWKVLKPVLAMPTGLRFFAFLASLAAAPVTIAMALAQFKLIPGLEAMQENLSDDYMIAGYPWSTVYLMIGVCPAVFEEIMYRGIILQRLLKIMSPGHAIIVSSAMFAIMHLSAIAFFFYLVPTALVAGWLTYRSKSLYPAMVLHFLHNAAIVFLEQYNYNEF